MAEYPIWAVTTSIKEGLSANEGLRQFRAGGGRIGRSTWLALRAEVGAALAMRPVEMAAQLDAVPEANHIMQFTTTNATGFLQQVEVLYRIKGTDTVVNRPFSVTGTELLTRQQAIQHALDTMAQAQQNGSYGEQVLLGAVYTGTYSMQPGAVE